MMSYFCVFGKQYTNFADEKKTHAFRPRVVRVRFAKKKTTMKIHISTDEANSKSSKVELLVDSIFCTFYYYMLDGCAPETSGNSFDKRILSWNGMWTIPQNMHSKDTHTEDWEAGANQVRSLIYSEFMAIQANHRFISRLHHMAACILVCLTKCHVPWYLAASSPNNNNDQTSWETKVVQTYWTFCPIAFGIA